MMGHRTTTTANTDSQNKSGSKRLLNLNWLPASSTENAGSSNNSVKKNDKNNSHHLNGVRRRFDDYDNNDNKKVHKRSCRDSLLVYIMVVKPRHLIRAAIVGLLTVCSLSLALRLQATNTAQQPPFFSLGQYQNYQNPSSSSSSPSWASKRVLFQQLPSTLRMPMPTTSRTDASILVIDAGYAIRPRVVGCYWPDDYDEIIVEDKEEAQQKHKRNKKKSGSKEEGAEVERKPPKSNSAVPLWMERLDPNLIRPLSDRSIYLSKDTLNNQVHLENSKDYLENEADPFEQGDCQAQYDWQKTSHPTCNNLHEQALNAMHAPQGDRVKFLAYGYWRDVWMMRDANWKPLALKTMRYEHDYAPRNYDRHRRDAVAMEHLTSSPNIVSIYSFCGNSGIFEFASGGSLEDAIWYSDEPEWNSTEKLIVAYQVASGLADLHNSDKEGVASISHTDITPSQFVFVNEHGRYLLNDFNRCRFIRWDQKEDQACPFQVGNNPGTFRSPEEYAYKDETEKIDVYSMGNIFYALLSKAYPYEDLSKKKAQKNIMKGARPPLADTLVNSKDKATNTLIKAMNMSWIHEPHERASAREVEKFLDDALIKLGVNGISS